MAIFDVLKTAARVAQEAGKIELYGQILEVYEKLLEQQKKIADLQAENKDLQGKLKTKENLISDGKNMYWIEKDGHKDGPFCTNCWDSEEKLMRLHRSISNDGIQCPKCKIWTVDPVAQIHRFGINSHWRNSGR